jgi:NAD(P)-dependent dehydrogenase (short-subunit alcohol dehydrogenase family)
MDDDMTHKPVVIVTGASRGLGAAVTCWLAQVGAAVTLIARSQEKLAAVAAVAKDLGGRPLVFEADVSDYNACKDAVGKTLDRFGRIDALVNNAGIVQPIAPVAESNPESWGTNIKVNLIGPFNLVRASISVLRRHSGRIVNVSSGAANAVLGSLSAYSAAKAALNHFTRILAAEEPAVTALSVRPGVVDTDMQTFLRDQGSRSMPAELATYYRQIKERGQLEPPEIPARSIVWLALHAPKEFSGKFLDYDDPRISGPALEVFGERIAIAT